MRNLFALIQAIRDAQADGEEDEDDYVHDSGDEDDDPPDEDGPPDEDDAYSEDEAMVLKAAALSEEGLEASGDQHEPEHENKGNDDEVAKGEDEGVPDEEAAPLKTPKSRKAKKKLFRSASRSKRKCQRKGARSFRSLGSKTSESETPAKPALPRSNTAESYKEHPEEDDDKKKALKEILSKIAALKVARDEFLGCSHVEVYAILYVPFRDFQSFTSERPEAWIWRCLREPRPALSCGWKF